MTFKDTQRSQQAARPTAAFHAWLARAKPEITDPQAGAPHHPELSMAAHLLEREEAVQ